MVIVKYVSILNVLSSCDQLISRKQCAKTMGIYSTKSLTTIGDQKTKFSLPPLSIYKSILSLEILLTLLLLAIQH